MNINGVKSGLDSLTAAQLSPGSKEKPGMSQSFEKLLQDVNQAQVQADQSAQGLNTGKSEQLHEVMINMEQADISMRLLVTMRNKVIDAYQEIMRMQV